MSINLKSKLYLIPSIICFGSSYSLAAENLDLDKLLDTPIKDLTKMEVTSVSKRAEKASEAAAAIFVITQEDIRRSGSNSIPEVLRIVPGVQVSRINSGWWSITARGNSEAFGNKLLVLIDGRSIYNPLFSGVLWDEQSTPLEDIERIEVIRGPGSTLYGANAVNGVINIITKNTKDTQGNLASAGAGSYDKFSGTYRYGGKLKEDTYRAYVNHYNQGDSNIYSLSDANSDAFDITRSGVRLDGNDKSNNLEYSFSSDFYKGEHKLPFVALSAVNGTGIEDGSQKHSIFGGNVIGKIEKKLDSGADVQFQAYYDFTGRDANTFGYKIHTLDLDGQENINLSDNHQFMWGLGYRVVYAELDNSLAVNYNNSFVTTNLFSGFAQDKIQILPDELYLTIGSKLEHNIYTGVEVEPNARVTWLPTQTQTVWGAVTRSVRSPSIAENEISQALQGTPIGLVYYKGNHDVVSEKMIAYELGYRNQLSGKFSVDATGFINDYSDLRTFESDGGAPLPTLDIRNKAYGLTRGLELSSNWQVSNDWNLSASYSYLDMDIKLKDGSTDTVGKSDDGTSPNNMFNVRSHYKIDDKWETDQALYYVDGIDAGLADPRSVKDYLRFDARIGYKPTDGVDLSLVGQNLFDNQHQEFGSAPYSQPAEIPRAVFGKVTVRF